MFILILFFSILSSCDAHASTKSDVRKGNVLYNSSKLDDAAKFYEKAASNGANKGIANFNSGCVSYRKNSYNNSIEYFNKAIASRALDVVWAADYNIGNAHYRIAGQKANAGNVKELYEMALKFYKRAIDLNPNDRDAKFNYEFVRLKMKAGGEKKNEKNQKNKNDQKKQDKKDQNKDQHKQQDQQDKKEQKQGGHGQQNEEKNEQKQQQDQQGQQNKEQGQGSGGEGQEDKEKQSGQGQGQDDKDKQDKKDEGQGSMVKGQGEKEEPEMNNEQRTTNNEKGGLAAYEAPQAKEGGLGEMTEQEAKMLLEGYKGEEATGRAIRMRRKTLDMPEPDKDW